MSVWGATPRTPLAKAVSVWGAGPGAPAGLKVSVTPSLGPGPCLSGGRAPGPRWPQGLRDSVTGAWAVSVWGAGPGPPLASRPS
jgi:hypothetical protein